MQKLVIRPLSTFSPLRPWEQGKNLKNDSTYFNVQDVVGKAKVYSLRVGREYSVRGRRV